MSKKKFYDGDAFYVEEKSFGTWQSHYPDGKGLITSLTEEDCIRSSRWYLQAQQEGTLDKTEEKTYSTENNYKL